MVAHLTRHQQVASAKHVVDDVDHTILHLVIHLGNERVGVDNRSTRHRVDAGVDVASEHGADGHTVLHVDGHHLRGSEVELGDIVAERVAQTLKAGSGHTVVLNLTRSVSVQAVDVCHHSLVGRSEARVGTVCRQDLIHAGTLEDIVEVAEGIGAVGQVTLNGLTGEGVEVILVKILLTAGHKKQRGQHQKCSQSACKLMIYCSVHCL